MLSPQKDKLPYLNIGCGNRFHPQWNNIDIVSNSKDVIEYDITQGIPFEKETFEMVYHSHVIEHIPFAYVKDFIEDCYRILKPGGVLRIAFPDLESITRLYLEYLEKVTENPTPENLSRYEWMKLELLDQMVRNHSGGMMKDYMLKKDIDTEFIKSRIGHEADKILHQQHQSKNSFKEKIKKFFNLSFYSQWRWVKSILIDKLYVKLFLFGNSQRAYQIGKFRIGGEIHQWMYDRQSIKNLLESYNFKNVSIHTAFTSNMEDWNQYELDGKDGNVFKPDSMFVEAIK